MFTFKTIPLGKERRKEGEREETMKKTLSPSTSSCHSIFLLLASAIFLEKWSLLCQPPSSTKATLAQFSDNLHIAKSCLFSYLIVLELLATIDMGHHSFFFYVMVLQLDINICSHFSHGEGGPVFLPLEFD